MEDYDWEFIDQSNTEYSEWEDHIGELEAWDHHYTNLEEIEY